MSCAKKESNNKGAMVAFLVGLVLARKAVPYCVHIFYLGLATLMYLKPAPNINWPDINLPAITSPIAVVGYAFAFTIMLVSVISIIQSLVNNRTT